MLPGKGDRLEETLSTEPLTDEERQKFRAMLIKEERMAWLWIFIRNTAYWLAGGLIAVSLVWDKFVLFAKWAIGK